MRSNYKYDVFISFTKKDLSKVKSIYKDLTNFGLKVWWSPEKLKLGKGFTREVQKNLISSQHFMLYCSESAAKSKWVQKEYEMFWNECHKDDQNNRRMYLLEGKSCTEECIPTILKDIHRTNTADEIFQEIIMTALNSSGKELEYEKKKRKKKVSELSRILKADKLKLIEAQSYYRHNRFWKPFSENREIHIYTCGRDTTPSDLRGRGGRTNIDKWDYRAVLDITHFFASNYPNTRVIIEDPISKLRGKDIEEPGRLAKQYANLGGMLADKNCIIIGSPDVSDFAEIVLAEIHDMKPYAEAAEAREKSKGFVIIKEKKSTLSSFYWKKKGGKEKEGVVQIKSKNRYIPFRHRPAKEGMSAGKMYGILTVANNPFPAKNLNRRKIIIMSGFSGVATNAIAKILTDDECLNEFFKLDNEYVDLDRNVEILISVKFIAEEYFDERDTRKISSYNSDIKFEKLVEI